MQFIKIIKHVRIILCASITTKSLNFSIKMILYFYYKIFKYVERFNFIFHKVYKGIVKTIIDNIDKISFFISGECSITYIKVNQV